jgi:hypothetical protein
MIRTEGRCVSELYYGLFLGEGKKGPKGNQNEDKAKNISPAHAYLLKVLLPIQGACYVMTFFYLPELRFYVIAFWIIETSYFGFGNTT